ncbi:MAG: hypothetical protein SAJ12_11790 [Jaaginema sp. PMC 1079.18]|nr:hypothetical protein [Jaaginema sp. PMC 1080.18]MEC4851687.1 hypothetical protein [Jaaginema sp. PMC 1079.18]MEC4867629.1 hypothetical protein [Jaaginema sp. PMC 1078.18]
MSLWKKIPFLSLTLLFLTYGLCGWSLAQATHQLWIWVVFGLMILILVIILVGPVARFRNLLGIWLQSDATAFLSVMVMAFVTVMLVTRLDLLAQWLVLLASGYLARLDLQRAGYQTWPTFAIAAIAALSGYGTGLALQQYFGHYLVGTT